MTTPSPFAVARVSTPSSLLAGVTRKMGSRFRVHIFRHSRRDVPSVSSRNDSTIDSDSRPRDFIDTAARVGVVLLFAGVCVVSDAMALGCCLLSVEFLNCPFHKVAGLQFFSLPDYTPPSISHYHLSFLFCGPMIFLASEPSNRVADR